MPAADAVTQLLDDLRPQLEEAGDREIVTTLGERALARGSSAAQQRAEYQRRGRLADVVDLLLRRTLPPDEPLPGAARPATGTLLLYARDGDEVLPPGGPEPAYAGILGVVQRLGPSALRARERVRNEEQRSRGVTFGVGGGASERLFPVDLVPRIVPAEDWAFLRRGLVQRARALDAFLHDVYGDRAAVSDGVLPASVVDDAPGCAASAPSSADRPCVPTCAAWISSIPSMKPADAGTSSRTTCGFPPDWDTRCRTAGSWTPS